MTIKEVKDSFQNVSDYNDPLFLEFENDPRKGVQKIITNTKKRISKLEIEKEKFRNRFNFETELWNQGLKYVAGIDEVGRGPLAGPVVAAAVILPKTFNLVDVNDSKQLTDKKRRELFAKIKQQAIAYNFSVISNEVIDEVNIYEATKIAMKDAVSGLKVQPKHLLIDAMEINTEIPQTKLIKGDAKSNSIAAASILAKVTRDNLMIDYNNEYPEYDFINNDGYGTAKHLLALKKFGITPIHRKTFAPVKNLIEK